MRHLGCSPHWTAVAPGDAVALVDEVEMRIQMNDVYWLLVRKRRDGRHRDRVVTAENGRRGVGIEQGAHGHLAVGEAPRRAGVHDGTLTAGVYFDDHRRQSGGIV